MDYADQTFAPTLRMDSLKGAVSEAALSLQTHPSYITASCQLRQASALGYIWKFSKISIISFTVCFLNPGKLILDLRKKLSDAVT